jgi:hypothetical protein
LVRDWGKVMVSASGLASVSELDLASSFRRSKR